MGESVSILRSTAIESPQPGLPPAPVDDGGDNDGDAGGLSLSRVLAAIRRYRWLVLAIIALGATGSVIATRFIAPEYAVSATIYIEDQRGGNRGPIRAEELLDNDAWVNLAKSFAVLDPVVFRTRLFVTNEPADSLVFSDFNVGQRMGTGKYSLKIDPQGRRFELIGPQGAKIDAGAVGDSIGRQLGYRWAPSAAALGRDRVIKFEVDSPRDASQKLLDHLATSQPGRGGSFLKLSLSWDDPVVAARVLNTLLDQFVAIADTLKRAKLAQLTSDLEEQVAIADSNLRAADTQLESFRVQTITEPKEENSVAPPGGGLAQTGGTVVSYYLQKRIGLNALEKDRRSIEQILSRAKATDSLPTDAFYTIDAVKNAPALLGVLTEVATTEAELRALRLRYTDEHQQVRSLKARLEQMRGQTVPQYAQQLAAQLRQRESDLRTELTGDAADLRGIPQRSMGESRYRRQADAAAEIFRNLQSRYQEAKLAVLSAVPDVRILDRAFPSTRQSKNTAPRLIFMGLMGSIGLALGLAVLLDRADKRFRYPEQASGELGLTILGAVPVVRQGVGITAPADVEQVVEAFRSIRLNLSHSFASGQPIALTITSPSPGDGKSLVAANLAISFAEAGFQTVIVDGDTRRGALHRTFGLNSKPGLLDYLQGKADLEAITNRTGFKRLSVITGGTRTTRAPELLGAAATPELFQRLRGLYEVILVDSPPLGAGIDAFVLATLTGHAAIVLRTGETNRELAATKLELMGRLPTRVLGAILNHIDVAESAYKYYAYEYNYEAKNEPEPPAEAPAAQKAEIEA